MAENFEGRRNDAENSKDIIERPEERCFLEKIAEIGEAEYPDSLKAHVCRHIERNHRSDRQILMFFIDLASGGISKGQVSHLVHKQQTQPFFDRFYNEIEMVREKVEERIGESLHIKGDLKNDLAWLGFQEKAEEIAEELGIDAGRISLLNPDDYSDEESGEAPEEESGLLILIRKLRKEAYPESLKAHVSNYILENCLDDEEVEGFFHDIENGGSKSGWIPHLITHDDMAEFYDEFYEDIEEIRKEIETIAGSPLDINNRLKSFFAHLAFDETANEIAREIGLEESR